MMFVYGLFIFLSVTMLLFGGLMVFSKPRDDILRPEDRFLAGISMITIGLFFDTFIFLAGQPLVAVCIVIICGIAVLVDRKSNVKNETSSTH